MSYAVTREFDRMHSLGEFCDGRRKTKVDELIMSNKPCACKIGASNGIVRSEIDLNIATTATPLVLGRPPTAPNVLGRVLKMISESVCGD